MQRRHLVVVIAVAVACGGGGDDSETVDGRVARDGATDGADIDATPGACAIGAQCDGVTGLCAPIVACSPASPCPRPGGGTETTPLYAPLCHTTVGTRPAFDDGAPRAWTDPVTGDARAACVYKPPGTSPASLRPLVVFLHGSGGSADDIYNHTLLRAKAATADLSGDPARPGFILVADQGRTLPNPNENLGPEPRHDIYHRNPSGNPDVRNLDRLIDELVGEGGVDPDRIYVMGWSNGAFFTSEYAITRHAAATAGGARIAAGVAFAGADPFQNIDETESPSCALATLPATAVPLYIIHRTCDSAVGCDAAQQVKFAMPPGYDVTAWVATLGALGDAAVTDVKVDANGVERAACAPTNLCTASGGLLNHVRWPDGVQDGSGNDWEPAMLLFLRAHPRP